MKQAERNLPTIKLLDVVYQVDIENDCLKSIDNSANTIPFSCMDYRGDHYVLSWRESPDHVQWNQQKLFAKIPQKVELDPEGIAIKFNLSIDEVIGKSDFDIIVDQLLYDDRVNKCWLPEVDIAGHKYFFDIRLKELRLTTDAMKAISLDGTFDELFSEQFCFYYDRRKKEIFEIDPDITSLPRGVVWIETPPIFKMDPVGVAKRIGDDIKNYLLSHPLERNLTAKVVPIAKTELVALVEANNKALNKDGDENLINKNRISNKNDQGNHL